MTSLRTAFKLVRVKINFKLKYTSSNAVSEWVQQVVVLTALMMKNKCGNVEGAVIELIETPKGCKLVVQV